MGNNKEKQVKQPSIPQELSNVVDSCDEIRSLKRSIASLKGANTRLTKENADLKSKISSVSSSRDKSINAKTTLEHDKAVLEDKIKELVKTNTGLLNAISALEDAKTDSEARLEAFLSLPWHKRIFL